MTAFKSKSEIKEGMLVRVINAQGFINAGTFGKVGVVIRTTSYNETVRVKFYDTRVESSAFPGAIFYFNLEKAFP